METFQSLLAKKLSEALAKAGLPTAGELTPATDPRFGDYQTNAALVLGKQRGENPHALAEKILAHLDVSDLCEPPVSAGAGFINFTLLSGAIEKRSEEHTSELQSQFHLVCRLLLEKKKKKYLSRQIRQEKKNKLRR